MAVRIVFVNKMYIPPKNMIRAAKKLAFTCLLVIEDTQKATQDILSIQYNGNMEVKKEENLLPFHKVDPLL